MASVCWPMPLNPEWRGLLRICTLILEPDLVSHPFLSRLSVHAVLRDTTGHPGSNRPGPRPSRLVWHLQRLRRLGYRCTPDRGRQRPPLRVSCLFKTMHAGHTGSEGLRWHIYVQVPTVSHPCCYLCPHSPADITKVTSTENDKITGDLRTFLHPSCS